MGTEKRSDTGDSWYEHRDRSDGKSDLNYGDKGSETHAHIVFDENRNVEYIRDEFGNVIADSNNNP